MIPIKELSLDRLPKEARHPWALDYVKHAASRTVKLITTWTSPGRPDAKAWMPGSRGTHVTPRGTGFLYDVDKTPSDMFKISTAAHQCFDQSEVENTRVLFFDDDEAQTGVVEARGLEVVYVDVDTDRCHFTCRVASLEEGRRLRQGFLPQPPGLPPVGFDLAFLVHHPHGISKHVSFGHITDAVRQDHLNSNQAMHLLGVFVEKSRR